MVTTKPPKGYPYISWQCIGGRYEPVLVTGPNPVAKPDAYKPQVCDGGVPITSEECPVCGATSDQLCKASWNE